MATVLELSVIAVNGAGGDRKSGGRLPVPDSGIIRFEDGN
jgi:hypothetical protein